MKLRRSGKLRRPRKLRRSRKGEGLKEWWNKLTRRRRVKALDKKRRAERQTEAYEAKMDRALAFWEEKRRERDAHEIRKAKKMLQELRADKLRKDAEEEEAKHTKMLEELADPKNDYSENHHALMKWDSN